MHTFLEESDAASLRRCHRRRAQDIAAHLLSEKRTSCGMFHLDRWYIAVQSATVACSSTYTGRLEVKSQKGSRNHFREDGMLTFVTHANY